MIKLFKPRPSTIRAIQWTGDNLEEIKAFCKHEYHDFEIGKENNELYFSDAVADEAGTFYSVELGDYFLEVPWLNNYIVYTEKENFEVAFQEA